MTATKRPNTHTWDDVLAACDAVACAAKCDSDAKAFAVGLDILRGLSSRPYYSIEPVLRKFWIGMIETAVPWGGMRDLLGE